MAAPALAVSTANGGKRENSSLFLGDERKSKEGLVRLFDNEFPRWGLTEEDLVVVGEIGLGLAGIPLIGPHLSKPGRAPHLEAYIREEKYKGPRVEQARHPKKITLGIRETKRIQDEYGLEVLDFLIADPDYIKLYNPRKGYRKN